LKKEVTRSKRSKKSKEAGEELEGITEEHAEPPAKSAKKG